MGVVFPEPIATPMGIECNDAYGCFPNGGAVLPRETAGGKTYFARGDLFVYASRAARNAGAQPIKIDSITVEDVDPEAAIYAVLYARVKNLCSCYDDAEGYPAADPGPPADAPEAE